MADGCAHTSTEKDCVEHGVQVLGCGVVSDWICTVCWGLGEANMLSSCPQQLFVDNDCVLEIVPGPSSFGISMSLSFDV